MPIYEYACPDCGHKFELIQKFSDEPAKDCPACKAHNVKKLVSLSAFQLQGGGWYKDHYGLKSPAGGGDTAAASTSSSTSTSTPAAAPAAAAPAKASSGSGGSAPAAT